MIFITLGSQKFQFNRLLKEVDRLIEQKTIKDSVFAQIGVSDYYPRNYAFKNFLNRDEFQSKMKESDLVITHGGTGAIIGALTLGKKVIAVPRLAKFGEHVDDHQLEIVKQFAAMKLIEPCYSTTELESSLAKTETSVYQTYESNSTQIIESIEKFLDI